MARTSYNPEIGPLPANTGGTHGGIDPAGGSVGPDAPAQGATGNPGTETPWEGADATQIGATTALPPLTHLGDAGGGHA